MPMSNDSAATGECREVASLPPRKMSSRSHAAQYARACSPRARSPRARARAVEMLAAYEAPELDPATDEALRAFIAKRMEELPDSEF